MKSINSKITQQDKKIIKIIAIFLIISIFLIIIVIKNNNDIENKETKEIQPPEKIIMNVVGDTIGHIKLKSEFISARNIGETVTIKPKYQFQDKTLKTEGNYIKYVFSLTNIGEINKDYYISEIKLFDKTGIIYNPSTIKKCDSDFDEPSIDESLGGSFKVSLKPRIPCSLIIYFEVPKNTDNITVKFNAR